MSQYNLASLFLVAASGLLTTTCASKRSTAIVLWVDTDIPAASFGRVTVTVTGRSSAGTFPMFSSTLTKEQLGPWPGSLVLAPRPSEVTEVDVQLHYEPTKPDTGSEFTQLAQATFARGEWRQLELVLPDQCTDPNIEVLCRTTFGPNGEPYTCGSTDPLHPCVQIRRDPLPQYTPPEAGVPDALERSDRPDPGMDGGIDAGTAEDSLDVVSDISNDIVLDTPAADAAPDAIQPALIDIPRAVWPPTGARVAGAQPRFQAALGVHNTGAEFEICADARCSMPALMRFRAAGMPRTTVHAFNPIAFPIGRELWWRVRGTLGAEVGTFSETRGFYPVASGARTDGSTLGRISDLNRDGYGDLVIGRPGTQMLDVGSVFIALSDGSGGFRPTIELVPNVPIMGQHFGSALSVCDFNGDGHLDLAVGSRGDLTARLNGRVAIYLGNASGNFGRVPSESIVGADPLFGSSLSAGDFTGDGYCDLVVGSPRAMGGPAFSGAVQIFAGTSGNLAMAPLVIPGGEANEEFGFSVASGGDLDQNYIEDVVIGAPEAGREGKILLLLSNGALAIPPSRIITQVPFGDQIGSRFGHSVVIAGDTNLDGLADVVCGSPGRNGYNGAVWWVGGAPQPMINTTPVEVSLGIRSMALGWTVNALGDVDGVGGDDFGASAPRDGALNAGSLTVFRNFRTGIAAESTLQTGLANGSWGWTACAMGDLDNDSVEDFAVSAPFPTDGTLMLAAMGRGFVQPVFGVDRMAPRVPGVSSQIVDPSMPENGQFGVALPR